MLLAPVIKADFTDPDCPPAASFSAYPCTCKRTDTSVWYLDYNENSVGLLTFFCGDFTEGNPRSFNDTDAAYIINQIPATTPIENFGLFTWSLTKIPANLSKFSTLSGIAFVGNKITSIDGADLRWPSLMTVASRSKGVGTAIPGCEAKLDQILTDSKLFGKGRTCLKSHPSSFSKGHKPLYLVAKKTTTI